MVRALFLLVNIFPSAYREARMVTFRRCLQDAGPLLGEIGAPSAFLIV